MRACPALSPCVGAFCVRERVLREESVLQYVQLYIVPTLTHVHCCTTCMCNPCGYIYIYRVDLERAEEHPHRGLASLLFYQRGSGERERESEVECEKVCGACKRCVWYYVCVPSAGTTLSTAAIGVRKFSTAAPERCTHTQCSKRSPLLVVAMVQMTAADPVELGRCGGTTPVLCPSSA